MISSNLNDSIRALALQGVPAADIAQEFGLDEAVVVNTLAARRATRTNGVIASLEAMGDEAVNVIRDVMNDAEAHPLVRLKAATYVADVATGIKAPANNVTQDAPIGFADTFKKFMDTYSKTMQRAKSAPQHEMLLDA